MGSVQAKLTPLASAALHRTGLYPWPVGRRGPSRLAPPASGESKAVADPLPRRRWNHCAGTQSAGPAVAGGEMPPEVVGSHLKKA